MPPKLIEGFQLKESYEIEITDILFERINNSFKDEDIGIRVRRTKRNGGSTIEFTYKKFLGVAQGMAKFDDENKKLSEEEYSAVCKIGLHTLNVPKIAELLALGEIYTLLEILNKRRAYIYSNGISNLEMVLEEIEYRSADKKASDAMMEIEILSDVDDINIEKFVQIVKEKYKAKPVDEGKNSRGIKI